jgi:hypothetical protein
MSGLPVRVDILLTSISNHEINVSRNLGVVNYAYQYEVRDSAGRLLEQKKHDWPQQTSTEVVRLEPGGRLTDGSTISELYDLSKPGEYTIQLVRPVSSDPGAEGIKSNTITMTVTRVMPFTLSMYAYVPGEAAYQGLLVVKAGSEINIHIEKINRSNHEIDCSSAWNSITGLDEKYQYDVRDGNGNPVGKHIVDRPVSLPNMSQTRKCKPGETAWTGDSTISRLYDLSRPGKYSIQASQPDSDNPEKGFVRSNTVTVEVTP